MNPQSLVTLLQGAVGEHQPTRDHSLAYIDKLSQEDPSFLGVLMQLISQDLKIAKIYLNYWIKQFASTFNQDAKMGLFDFLIRTNEARSDKLLQQSIIHLAGTEYKDERVQRWLLDMTDYGLKCSILKHLQQQDGSSESLLLICRDVVGKLPAVQDQYVALKLLALSFKILPQQQKLSCYFPHLTQILSAAQTDYRLLYLYQKMLLTYLEQYPEVDLKDVVTLIQIFDQFYFSNSSLKIHSIYSNDFAQFKAQLRKAKEPSIQERYSLERVIYQMLKIVKTICSSHTYNQLEVLNQNQQAYEFEVILYEQYFAKMLQFFIRYSLNLSLSQVYDIYFDQEAAYEEQDRTSYEIRALSIDLIKLALQSMQQEFVSKQINHHFQQVPELTSFSGILQKEAIYYLLRNVFYDVEFEIDLYLKQFCEELQQQSPFFDPLKIAILRVIKIYLEISEEIPQDVCQRIIQNVVNLQSENIAIILLQIDLIRMLIQFFEPRHLEVIWKNCQLIHSKVENPESKVCIYNFWQALIQQNLITDFTWIIEQLKTQWQLGHLSVQQEILKMITEILQRQFLLTPELLLVSRYVIASALQTKEVLLVEESLETLLMLLSRCNEQQEAIDMREIQQALLRFEGQMEYWNQQILVCLYLLAQQFYDEQLMVCTFCQLLALAPEIKDEAQLRVLIPIEIYVKQKLKAQSGSDENVKRLVESLLKALGWRQGNEGFASEVVYILSLLEVGLDQQLLIGCYEYEKRQKAVEMKRLKVLASILVKTYPQIGAEAEEMILSDKNLEEAGPASAIREMISGRRLKVPSFKKG